MDQLLARGLEMLVWMESNLSLSLLILSGLSLPGVLIFLMVQLEKRPTQEAFRALETRLMRLSAAVELLTDTTESGLQTAFAEIERLGGTGARVSTRAGLQTRVLQAAQSGQSVREIAQAEHISEGEVQLRLGLHQKAASTSAAAPEEAPAAATVAPLRAVGRSV